MRAWIFIGLIVFSSGLPRTEQGNATQKHDQERKQAPTPTPSVRSVPSEPASEVKNESPAKEKEEIWQKAFGPESWPNWALVIVGFAGIWAALSTLKDIQRQTSAIERQVGIMVQIERPWLLVEINPTATTQFIAGRNIVSFQCLIKNFGKTPAWITSSVVKGRDVENEPLSSEPVYGDIKDSIPQVLPPEGALSFALSWLPEILSQAHEDKLFLYIFGFVRYKDGFGQACETKFCFRYYPPFRDNKAQGWHVGGPPAYNKQT